MVHGSESEPRAPRGNIFDRAEIYQRERGERGEGS